MSLVVCPLAFPVACSVIDSLHRHHRRLQGHKFSLGVATLDGAVVGAAIVGRPVARALDDGLTLEVTRLATDGTRNACSLLYGAAWRAAKACGYHRIITYTQEGEGGASLRAAGWRVVARRPPRAGWDAPGRPRRALGTEGVPRLLWENSSRDWRVALPGSAPAPSRFGRRS